MAATAYEVPLAILNGSVNSIRGPANGSCASRALLAERLIVANTKVDLLTTT